MHQHAFLCNRISYFLESVFLFFSSPLSLIFLRAWKNFFGVLRARVHYYMRVSFSVCSLLFGRKKFAKGLVGNEKGVLL